jgi:pilus assembly protein TadC
MTSVMLILIENKMEKYNNIDENYSKAQANFNKEEAYLRAKKKLDKLKGFYWHLASYIVVNAFLIIMIAINLDYDKSIWQFGTFATAIFWGIGLAFHAMGVFGPDLLFGKSWEERKINEYMDKDKQHWE